MDNLGDRIKGYESVSTKNFIPKIPIIVRVDGRAFHTWTKQNKCIAPFDYRLISTKYLAAEQVALDSGAVAFYSQSDEVTFLYLDDQTIQTQQWFGGRQSKIESISAAAMTAHFNLLWMRSSFNFRSAEESFEYLKNKPAMFDARAFQCPKNDVANVFLWRVRDWERNSLNMYCGSYFSSKQLAGKKAAERHEMLHRIGKNWADLPDLAKNGMFWHKDKGFNMGKMAGYDDINEFLGI